MSTPTQSLFTKLFTLRSFKLHVFSPLGPWLAGAVFVEKKFTQSNGRINIAKCSAAKQGGARNSKKKIEVRLRFFFMFSLVGRQRDVEDIGP